MTKFIIKDDFWELFSDSAIGIVLAFGINSNLAENEKARKEIEALLKEGNESAKKFLVNDVLSENQVVKVWRDAYQKFKTKKGARASIEALLKRISKDNPVGNIIPLVDIYNYISLTYGIPVGGEDLDKFEGDMVLTKAEGGEPFMALGDTDNDPALKDEIIYKDDVGAVCRCWNWRDGQRTMLTEETKNAFLIIESVDPSRLEDVKKAMVELEALTLKYLGGKTKVMLLTKDNKEMELKL